MSIQLETEIKAHSKVAEDVTSHGSNFDFNKEKEENPGPKRVIANNEQMKVTDVNLGDCNVDDSIQLSAISTNSSVSDIRREDLSSLSQSSEKDYLLNIDTTHVGSNNGSHEDSIATKGCSSSWCNVAAGGKNCAQGLKDSSLIPYKKSEVPEPLTVIENKQAETVALNSITNIPWLHLFEEPFPRRSPRIQEQIYKETLLAKNFNEPHIIEFSDKLFLDNNQKQKNCVPSPTNSECSLPDNSSCSASWTANSASTSQHDIDQEKLVNNKTKSKLAVEQFSLSQNSKLKTSQCNSKKSLVQKQRKHKKDSLVTKSRKTHEPRRPEQENCATLDSSVKKSDLDGSCKFLFPKPSIALTKPGGPLSVIVDFSLPDKEFAKLKLQKIKNSNAETKGSKSRTWTCSDNLIHSMTKDLLCSIEDKEMCDEKVKCKHKEDEPVSQLPQTSGDVTSKLETLMKIDKEFIDVKQQQSTTEFSVKQNKSKSDMLEKQYRALADGTDAFEKSPTSTCTKLNYASCGSEKFSDKNNSNSETSNYTDLEEAVLIDQNIDKEPKPLRISRTHQNAKIALNANQNASNT